MTRHLRNGVVAVCNGKVPNLRLAELTDRIDAVTCNRCKARINAAAKAMGRATQLDRLIAATKPTIARKKREQA